MEEGTTNLVVNPTTWKPTTDQYQTTTETADRLYGCVVSETVKLIASTPPTTLASLTIAPGETYTASIYVQKVTLGGDLTYPQLIFYKTGENKVLVKSAPAADTNEWQRLVVTYTNDTDIPLPVLVLYYSTHEVGAITRQAAPQVEKKPFATSFVNGTRANGRLGYEQFPEGPFTVAVWGKTFDFRAAHRMPFGKWTRFYYSVNPSNNLLLSWTDSTGAQRTVSGSITIDPLDWHFYVLTWDGTTLIGYVDGDEHVRAASDPPQPGGTFGWGNISGAGSVSYPWNGLLDEGLILPYAATEEEIAAWYQARGAFVDQAEINYQQSQIVQLADNIEASVSRLEEDIDEHGNRLASVENAVVNVLPGQIALKANASEVYKKGEIDTKLGQKADTATVNELTTRITSAEQTIDAHTGIIAQKAERTEVYTKTETDAKLGTNTLTKWVNLKPPLKV